MEINFDRNAFDEFALAIFDPVQIGGEQVRAFHCPSL